MSMYEVYWTEKHKATIEADHEDEAISKAAQSDPYFSHIESDAYYIAEIKEE